MARPPSLISCVGYHLSDETSYAPLALSASLQVCSSPREMYVRNTQPRCALLWLRRVCIEVLEPLIEVWKVKLYIVEVEKLFRWPDGERDGKCM